jgi:uncharacterized protein RhaS with RHS repeats
VNVRYATFGYLNGAAVSTEHAAGVDKYSINDSRSTSSGAGTMVVTYPSGASYTSTYASVNGFSKETANTQPAGSGCSAATSARTYDANGNTASVVDLDAADAQVLLSVVACVGSITQSRRDCPAVIDTCGGVQCRANSPEPAVVAASAAP